MPFVVLCMACHRGVVWENPPVSAFDGKEECPLCHAINPGWDMYEVGDFYGYRESDDDVPG